MSSTFITYGTQRYYNSLHRINDEATKMPFNKIYALNDSDLPKFTEFWERHRDFILGNPRGGGYWLWKPFLVKMVLESMSENDVLVWADAGCTLVPEKAPRLLEYFEMARSHGIVTFELTAFPHKSWSKMDTVIAMNTQDKLDIPQIIATSFIICKRPDTVELVNKWYELCSNYHLLDDSPSTNPNDPTFQDHRHDQSILSMLVRNQFEKGVLTDETWPPNDPNKGPIRASRLS